MSDYWSNYWKQGHLTSFGQDIEGNYVGRLAQYWLSFFNGLPSRELSLVDIGTGNGALIELALRTSGSSFWKLIGVDAASLSVPNSVQAPNVYFKENTQAESLPFEDNSIDIVISQFGIEYADLARALPEVSRVLKPAGKFQVIMHDSSSCIVQPNTIILHAAKILQSDKSPLHSLKKLIEAIEQYDIQSEQVTDAKYQLDNGLKVFIGQCREGMQGTNFPAFLNTIMHPKYSYSQRQTMLQLFISELDGQVARLTELCGAAKNAEKKNEIEVLLAQLGMIDINSAAVIEHDGRLIGWQVGAVNG